MSGRLGLIAVAVAFAAAASCGAGIAVLGGSTACGIPVNPTPGTGPAGALHARVHTAHGDWAADQLGNAATILHIGQTLDIPARGRLIALATAMQESRLHNLSGGDLDSIGLFQQRPSQGWGTPDQLSDPVYASGAFYDRLLSISGWQTMPLADAAQAVQHSATPGAYSRWETDAATLVAAVGSESWRANPVIAEQCPSSCPEIVSTTTAGLRNRPNADGRLIASVGVSSHGLLKISGSTAAQIARNGHGRRLRIAQDLPDPTAAAAVGAENSPANPVDLEQCLSSCPDILSSSGAELRSLPDAERLENLGCGGDPAVHGLPDDYTLPADTPPAAATAVAWAIGQLGTPYHYGGDCTDPHSGDPAHQCDCSSLVQQAYRAAGISLPRTAADQSHAGTPVPGPGQLRPGDLLFVPGADGTAARPGHVGLYLGDQLILDAPNQGAVVHISLISSYWLTDLSVRRIVPAGSLPPP